MELSVICAEDFPLFLEENTDSDYLMSDMLLKSTRVQCSVWPAGPVPENFHDPVSSEIPVLLLSGELDPVTPPRYADQVQVHFSNSMHLVAPGQGHSVTGRGCMGRLVSEFVIAGSSAELDTECIGQMQPTPYFISLTGPTP